MTGPAPSSSPDEPTAALLVAHRALVGALLEASLRYRAHESLSPLLNDVLGLVACGNVSTVSTLATATGRSAAAVSRAVTELTARQLVTRREDPQDRRVHLLELSERGESVMWDRLEHLRTYFDLMDETNLDALVVGLLAFAEARARVRASD